MIAPAIIAVSCIVIFIGFVLVTSAYDRGRRDGRDEGRDEVWEKLGGDTLPPLDPPWNADDTISLTEKGQQLIREYEREISEAEAAIRTRSNGDHYYDDCTMEWKKRHPLTSES